MHHKGLFRFAKIPTLSPDKQACRSRAGYSKRIRRASSSSRSLKLHDMMHIVHHIVEGYRSGHNEAVLKTVWGNPRGFESHTLRQKRTNFCLPKVRSFFIHCESNGISSRFSVHIITEGCIAFAMIIRSEQNMQHAK